MGNRWLFLLSLLGVSAAVIGAAFFAIRPKANPPVFNPASNPYESGIYANGIIESEQASGANVNVFPEVAGTVTDVMVQEGQNVGRGTPLVHIEDSLQQATVAQQRAQVAVAEAQARAAQATLKTASDQLAKQQRSYEADPRSVSNAVLDDAGNAVRVAEANLAVAERQRTAQDKAAATAEALLAKYTIRAPIEGTVLSLGVSVGSYVSPQGTLDTYTRGATPIVVMGRQESTLAVRAFIDEILIAKLGKLQHLEATMYVRGTDVSIPLEFVRVQPYVSPKVELSNARTERVDLRVLPVVFHFRRTPDVKLYPGQLVDVYVRSR
jgi:HlyD family secretion protein